MEYFSSIFGGGFACPYDVGEKHGECWGGWEHYRATGSTDKKPVSLFKITVSKTDSEGIEMARNGVKRLRVTKHPRILSFEWAGEQENQKQITFHLVTEPVTPLPTLLDELALSGDQKHEYLALGLRQVTQAAAFLNNQCKLVHGNVCWASVLVTNDLDWKLGFLDLSTEHASLAQSPLLRQSSAIAPHYRPPELSKGSVSGPVWAIDAWGLGCLMQEAFCGRALQGAQQLVETSAIPPPLVPDYQKLLTTAPAKRLNPDKLMENEFLKSELVDTMHFLENLSIKEPNDKQRFFRALQTSMPSFPDVVCTRKLLPLISAALAYGGAPAIALGCLLKIGKMLPEEEFRARVIPVLAGLFASPDQSIRTSLLDNIADYAAALPEAAVEGTIFPQLSKGLTQPNAFLREATLKALLPIAPKLSQRTLTGPLLKHLAKLQVDEEPSIRANTTVLLGNIAPSLGAAACRRILLNAFTRALKDIYAPSRSAALKALMATASYHSAQDVAARVVPSIAPLMLDASSDVRQVGCKAMDFFVKLLQKASADIAKGVDPSKPPSDGAAAEASKAATSVTSFLGWAMTTVSAVSSSTAAPAAVAKKPADAALRPSGGGDSPAARPGGMQQGASAAHAPVATATLTPAASDVADAAAAFDDGWGDEDDDDLFEDMAGGAAPAAEVGAAVAAAKAVAREVPAAAPAKSVDTKVGEGWGDTDNGWGDADEGWDASETAPVVPKVVPKRPAKAKAKLKLGISRKNDGKAD